MEEVLIIGALRTAVGKLGGALKDVPVEDLAAAVIRGVVDRSGLDPRQIDQVILGQAKQSSDSPNLARLAALMADVPTEVPAYTVHRQCGSGLQSVINAAHEIRCGDAGIVLAGGAESMSTAPYYLRSARYGYGAGNGELLDPNTESQPRSQPIDRYGHLTMGLTAENLAEQYAITREEQDLFALNSQEKAYAAIEGGRFRDEILPYEINGKRQTVRFEVDEHPRRTTLDQLSVLKPAFKPGGTVTAGNSSGRNDGAAALVVTSGSRVRELGVRPMARIVSYGTAGVSPEIMGIGPVPATRLALARAGLKLDDIDLVELNEAFAAQSLAVIKELGIDPGRVNVNGGAIALGHPIGCSGARILATLLYEMRRRRARYGLATLCIAGGQGIAMVVENLD